MQATPSHEGRKDLKFKVCSAHSIYSTVSERSWSFLKVHGRRVGKGWEPGFSGTKRTNCSCWLHGYSVTPEKQALGLLKKEVLSILKTIPLRNSTSVETLKGQIVSKKKKKKYLR